MFTYQRVDQNVQSPGPRFHQFPWNISQNPGSITSLGAALALVATKGGAWPWGFHVMAFWLWKKAIVISGISCYISTYGALHGISWPYIYIYIYMYIYFDSPQKKHMSPFAGYGYLPCFAGN